MQGSRCSECSTFPVRPLAIERAYRISCERLEIARRRAEEERAEALFSLRATTK
jgi:hypothetical protein